RSMCPPLSGIDREVSPMAGNVPELARPGDGLSPPWTVRRGQAMVGKNGAMGAGAEALDLERPPEPPRRAVGELVGDACPLPRGCKDPVSAAGRHLGVAARSSRRERF